MNESAVHAFVAPALERQEAFTVFYGLALDGLWPSRVVPSGERLGEEDWKALEAAAADTLAGVIVWHGEPKWSRLMLPQNPAGLAAAWRNASAKWERRLAPIERFVPPALEHVAGRVKSITLCHVPTGEGREARGLIAALTSWQDVARGRFVAMRAERYFTRFFEISAPDAARAGTAYRLWAGGREQRRLVITRRIDVVDTLYRATVYNEGGGVSCMCGRDWKTKRHPACAYVPADSNWHVEAALPLSDADYDAIEARLTALAGDLLAVAFLVEGAPGDALEPGRVLARSVVYPGAHRHVRPYGRTADDRAEIADVLEGFGLYRDDDLSDARLYLHWEGEHAPMPYLDGYARYVAFPAGSDKPAFAFASMDEENPAVVETSTDGYVRHHRLARCECCGEPFSERELVAVAVGPGETQRWCESCRDEYARSLDYSVSDPAGAALYIDADRARSVVGRGGWFITVPDWEPIETFRDDVAEGDIATLWWDCERGWIIDESGAREGNIAVLRDAGTPLASIRWVGSEYGRAPDGRLWVSRPGVSGEAIRRALALVVSGGADAQAA